jgi:hypothetical protein
MGREIFYFRCRTFASSFRHVGVSDYAIWNIDNCVNPDFTILALTKNADYGIILLIK